MKRLPPWIAVIVVLSVVTASAEEAQNLGRVVVTATRLPGRASESSRSVTTLDQDLLGITEYNAIPDRIAEIGGIDVRRRGVEGVQSDVSIRGTTFEQNTVLIDGIKVNDPQTGHFSTDIPLTSMDVDRIDIVKGPASSVYGPNAFGGVIDVVTKRPEGNGIIAHAEGGSFDYFDTGLSVSTAFRPLVNRFSIEERRSSGYIPETEFDILTVTDNAVCETPFGVYDFLFGYMNKDFGAADFYSNLFPNEQEQTDTRFFKICGAIESGALSVNPKLFLRRHKDKFALDANRPGWQTNYSTTYNYGFELNCALENELMDTAYGFELARDTIDSTNLQTHSRTNEGLYMELAPHLADKLYLNIGLREDYFGSFGWQFSPSVNVSYALMDYLSVRGLIGRAYRIPTFTDLYYNDAANKGNASLRPESCWSYEAGLDYKRDATTFSSTFFHRDGRDTIDWIRYSPRNVWQAENIGTTSTNGVEVSASIAADKLWKDSALTNVFVTYTAIDTYAKHDYLSKYALDYLKQQICTGAQWQILGFKNSWILNYKKRVGDSGYIVVDTKVSRDIVRKGNVSCEAFLEVSNLFDIDYSEQSGVEMPGRWIRSGARISF